MYIICIRGSRVCVREEATQAHPQEASCPRTPSGAVGENWRCYEGRATPLARKTEASNIHRHGKHRHGRKSSGFQRPQAGRNISKKGLRKGARRGGAGTPSLGRKRGRHEEEGPRKNGGGLYFLVFPDEKFDAQHKKIIKQKFMRKKTTFTHHVRNED